MKKIAGLGCIAFLIACSGGSSDTTNSPSPDGGSPSQADAAGGADGASAEKPQALFTGTLKAGSNDCRDEGELFSVGSGTPVKTGEASGQGTVDIACSVVPTADGAFTVSATVVQSGATGGLFTVDGTFKSTGEQNDIRVRASSKLKGNSYDQTDRKCVVSYSEPAQGVAAGRVSGTIVCPSAVNTADSARACEIDAQFRFENCTQ